MGLFALPQVAEGLPSVWRALAIGLFFVSAVRPGSCVAAPGLSPGRPAFGEYTARLVMLGYWRQGSRTRACIRDLRLQSSRGVDGKLIKFNISRGGEAPPSALRFVLWSQA
jgi:hypothetical protein